MPVKIGTVLNKLAARLGVDATTPEFIELLSANVDVPDSIASAFETARVLTPDSAKNDPELKKMFFAQALNGVDSRISALLDEYQVPEDLRAEISGAGSTFDKVPLLGKAIKALEAQKVGATAGEKANLQQQINALQAEKANEIAKINEQHTAEIGQYVERLQSMAVRGKISGKKLDTTKFDPETMQDIAFNMLNKALTQKGAKIVNQNDTFVLKRAEDETLDYYENNQAVTLDSFIDQVLANNKLLAVTDPAPAPGNNPGQRQQSQPMTPTAGGQPQPSNGFLSRIEQAKADFAANRVGV